MTRESGSGKRGEEFYYPCLKDIQRVARILLPLKLSFDRRVEMGERELDFVINFVDKNLHL